MSAAESYGAELVNFQKLTRDDLERLVTFLVAGVERTNSKFRDGAAVQGRTACDIAMEVILEQLLNEVGGDSPVSAAILAYRARMNALDAERKRSRRVGKLQEVLNAAFGKGTSPEVLLNPDWLKFDKRPTLSAASDDAMAASSPKDEVPRALRDNSILRDNNILRGFRP